MAQGAPEHKCLSGAQAAGEKGASEGVEPPEGALPMNFPFKNQGHPKGTAQKLVTDEGLRHIQGRPPPPQPDSRGPGAQPHTDSHHSRGKEQHDS